MREALKRRHSFDPEDNYVPFKKRLVGAFSKLSIKEMGNGGYTKELIIQNSHKKQVITQKNDANQFEEAKKEKPMKIELGGLKISSNLDFNSIQNLLVRNDPLVERMLTQNYEKYCAKNY